MAYPDDFDTSAFPAWKRIALSRTAGVWVMVAFFLIILLCIAIPWVVQNEVIEPFVIYVDAPHGKWELVGRQNQKQTIPYYIAMQRAVVGIFVQEWFSLSGNQEKNVDHWGKCDRKEVCVNHIESSIYGDENCGIFCLSGEELYNSFTAHVVPLYQATAEKGERWYVIPTKIEVTQNGPVSTKEGSWIVHATIHSSTKGNFEVIAYVQLKQDIANYPQTLGYHVTKFNAYKEQ